MSLATRVHSALILVDRHLTLRKKSKLYRMPKRPQRMVRTVGRGLVTRALCRGVHNNDLRTKGFEQG